MIFFFSFFFFSFLFFSTEEEKGMEEFEKLEATLKNVELATDSGEHLKKEHLNIVFIGHVDAGKSTIGGQILYEKQREKGVEFQTPNK